MVCLFALSVALPTYPRGARRIYLQHSRSETYFNPRARVGHDRVPGRTITRSTNFNPRAREGHDKCAKLLIWLRLTFQSTCPRGARRFLPFCVCLSHKFQSTCPRGARLKPFSRCNVTINISIHVPARGTT